jgi:plastocyanin
MVAGPAPPDPTGRARGLARTGISLTLGLFVLLAAGPLAAATLTGTVSSGRPALKVAAHISHDRSVCGVDEPVYERLTELDAHGHLKDALVFVDTSSAGGTALPPVKKGRLPPYELDQRNCVFLPRVGAARAGTKLLLKNSDPVLHNVHVYRGGKETVFNYAMPIQGQQIEAGTLAKPGQYTVRCDAGHVWMGASLWVFAHPYFSVTGKDGVFSLEGLPKGRHKLVAWHPDLGRIERWVEIGGDNPVPSVDLRF